MYTCTCISPLFYSIICTYIFRVLFKIIQFTVSELKISSVPRFEGIVGSLEQISTKHDWTKGTISNTHNHMNGEYSEPSDSKDTIEITSL